MLLCVATNLTVEGCGPDERTSCVSNNLIFTEWCPAQSSSYKNKEEDLSFLRHGPSQSGPMKTLFPLKWHFELVISVAVINSGKWDLFSSRNFHLIILHEKIPGPGLVCLHKIGQANSYKAGNETMFPGGSGQYFSGIKIKHQWLHSPGTTHSNALCVDRHY